MNDIANKISRQNIKLPSGSIETQDRNLLLRFDEQKITPETLAHTVIGADSAGAVIRLGDVATITDRFALDEQRCCLTARHRPCSKSARTKPMMHCGSKSGWRPLWRRKMPARPQG
ncbi:cation/multidrug efflux pump [Photobacterium aphoticum]|uniref:Cation/multidrug efflux pump n=1 Tax=Photobacterium aphoticum TaxID=754436 RepID=A0A090QXP1_9GAMM|nr:cation/multidrug efflux pump [Photobacterium aphoticum]